MHNVCKYVTDYGKSFFVILFLLGVQGLPGCGCCQHTDSVQRQSDTPATAPEKGTIRPNIYPIDLSVHTHAEGTELSQVIARVAGDIPEAARVLVATVRLAQAYKNVHGIWPQSSQDLWTYTSNNGGENYSREFSSLQFEVVDGINIMKFVMLRMRESDSSQVSGIVDLVDAAKQD
jgi:hypothetical protein